MFTQITESILLRVVDSFLSKVAELTADNSLSNMNNIKDFELSLKSLQKKLKSLIAKASDVEEEIKNAELFGRKKRKREVEEWLEQVESTKKEVVELGSEVESEGFITRLRDGGKVAKLNDEVENLVEQSRNFGELVLDVYGVRGETFLTSGMVGKAFDENLERILNFLSGREVSRIGVYGMGGVGKTTLAKHIHNRLLQQSQGQHVIWVTVSQEFTIMSLQDKIAHFIGICLLDEDDEDIRAARLHRALSQMKKSVLILDDVWENIDMLKVGYPFSVECCRLIITTRSLEVCRQIRCQKVIHVEKLHKDEAWKLFHETLGNEMEFSPQVEDIAKSVARLCDCLPLAIITVAGSMRGETSMHTWTNALAELNECVVEQDGVGGDEVFKVLKYSFDRLNRNHRSHEFNTLQLCFMYCSLYPEDYEIPRENLVRKLISEGLFHQRKSRRAQVHQGHSVLDKLLNVCLLESCVGNLGSECVKLHDLVRGMALKIGEGRYMVRAGDKSSKDIPDEEEWTQGLEKVSLMYNRIRRIGDGTSPCCPMLSTLLLRGNPLAVIPDSFFSKLQSLCTLDLSETAIRKLPDSICDMKSLKAMLLMGCNKLKKVPYLGKLKALRELNLSYTAISDVPQGLEELLKLEFLSMSASALKMLPRGMLLKLGHLQHVSLPFHVEVPIEEIESLESLEEFRGGLKNVSDFNSFIRRVPVTFYAVGLGWCNIILDNVGTRGGGDSRYYDNELILSECNLQDEKIFGQDIVYLTISQCKGLSICFMDDFSQLNNPTSLKRLKIERCGGIECILILNEQGLPSQISNLEFVALVELEDLKRFIEIDLPAPAPAQVVFSSLRRLRIEKCNKTKKLGISVVGVPNLETIQIFDCREIEEIFEDEGRGSVTLPRLQELRLSGLPRLKSVCKARMICNSIIDISIVKCRRLPNKLPVNLDVPPPPTLTQIMVGREWWESLEWENPDLPRLLQPFVRYS